MLTISNRGCTATVHPTGALISQWCPTGHREVLFCSRDTVIDPAVEVHGGIPICAPWFGTGREAVTVPHKHGLVRYADWELENFVDGDDAAELTWTLTADQLKGKPGAEMYPESMAFRYTMRLSETLDVELEVKSDEEFILDEALHTYFAVTDVRHTGISGLGGVPYHNSAEPGPSSSARQGDAVPVPIDRIYQEAPDVVIHDADRDIHITSTGTRSTIVWTPGPEGASRLTYFAADEWEDMLCVEVGNVQGNSVTVPAGGSHTMGLHLCVTHVA